jgi:enoyl-CoA hydratase
LTTHSAEFGTSTHFTSHDSIAVLSFSSPGYPRMTRALLQELRQLLDMLSRLSANCEAGAVLPPELGSSSGALFHGVVIAAGPTSFATGAELDEVSGLDGIAARDFARIGQELCDQIEHLALPVVAAIRGYCLGGGLDLALACHARVASYDASLGHPGPALGLLTGWGGTQRLPRLVGKAAALQALLTAERIPATQALTLGLVNELASPQDLVDVACRWAERLYTSLRTTR